MASSEKGDISQFKYPGQFVWENMILIENHPVSVIERCQSFNELRSNDTVVASYPKTGTTLAQEIVWLANNNADVEMSRKVPNFIRVPFIDIAVQGPKTFKELFDGLTHPKTIKAHVPYEFLPKTVRQGSTKCVYILRNPKDTLVSFYHFHRMNATFGNFPGTWDDFFEFFKRNDYLLLYGNPLDHMLSYWERRNDANLLLVFYEDLLLDKENSVRKIGDFLEAKLTVDQVKKIAEATSFKSMKSSPYTSYQIEKLMPMQPGQRPVLDNSVSEFLRKGEIGDWKNYFNEEQNRIIDEMCEKKLAGTGLKFRYQ